MSHAPRILPRIVAGASLVPWFLKELVKSCLQVALDCIRPRLTLSPAIVQLPLRADISDAEIFLLSSLITLTPGTLTLDVAGDRSCLMIHCLHGSDPEALVQELQDGMARRVRGVFR
ncbi:Na+/H+ antiporter subunit E [Gemmobacter sp. 24YEA27]|uniref:Na+/H+ antiporter subunit E n=1 Tax=Gemmobacter sp. 24YEA27 TaxID=3040672 RepID=UPI0024B39A8C|nr:Na+/H+ antiporter subunit E [Gemmobacter sp. 24YEA27]